MIETWPEGTLDVVKRVLLNAQAQKTRLRLFLGQTKTGVAWPEEFDVIGYIGNTTGNKSPIFLYNVRSDGGMVILCEHIVAIFDVKSKTALYKHPTFSVGEWKRRASLMEGYFEDVLHNGEVHARFKKNGQAHRYIGFMKGERFSK